MDTYFFSHITALWLLRKTSAGDRAAAGERTNVQPPEAPPRVTDVRALMDTVDGLRDIGLAPHFLTSCKSGSRHGDGFVCHTWRRPLPPGAAAEIADGVFCASPEFLPVLMAPQLTALELTVLLSELMGLYLIDPSEEDRGMRQRTEPLTTPEKIEAFLDGLGKANGTAAVRRAMRHACVRSGSPRETKLSLRLGLKPSMGGYGLPVLAMNEPMEVERIGRALENKGTRRPDILIKAMPEATGPGAFEGVAFEYDGSDHLTPERAAEDLKRGNELKAMGLKEYRINKKLYKDINYMDGIAEQARRDAGYGRRHMGPEEAQRLRSKWVWLFCELEKINGLMWNGKKREEERRQAEEEVRSIAAGIS